MPKKKARKVPQQRSFIKAGDYPYINPIIVSAEKSIIDGVHRFHSCQQLGCKISSIELPFKDDELHSEECIEAIVKLKKSQSKKLDDWFKKNNVGYKSQITLCGSDDKFHYFNMYKDKLKTNEEFTTILREVYSLSSNTFRFKNNIKDYFTSDRIIKEILMSAEEIHELGKLPEEVIVFRGMTQEEDISNDYGVSWTLDKNKAIFFAEGYLHNYENKNQKKIVKEIKIAKKNIIAFFNDRGEKEVIYIHRM